MKTDCEILFELFDVTARRDGAPRAEDRQPWVKLGELHEEDQAIDKYGTLEGQGCPLDGKWALFPAQPEHAFLGLWTVSQTGEDGRFAQPPQLWVDFTQPHSSIGLTLTFAEASQDWADSLRVRWYGEQSQLLADRTYAPDQAVYFCDQQVERYFRLEFTFYSTNKPYHFLKLTGIEYGARLNLTGDRLISANVVEELDPISDTVRVGMLYFQFHSPAGTFDLLNLTGAYKMFQANQRARVTAWQDGQRLDMGDYFLQEAESDGSMTSLTCTDLTGVIDGTEYLGGMWPDGIAAGALIADIMRSAETWEDYTVHPSLVGVVVKGYLPICTHREALHRVAFAIGACVSGARGRKLRIFPLSRDSPYAITPDEKLAGHTITLRELVTGVEIYADQYSPTETQSELFREHCQPGERFIRLHAPASSLSCTGAVLLESGVNWACVRVDAPGDVTLSGCVYDVQSSLAGSVSAAQMPVNARQNVISLTGCTLIADAQAQAARIFDHYQQRLLESGDLLPGRWETGDQVRVLRQGGNALTGTITALDIDLTGGGITHAEIIGR